MSEIEERKVFRSEEPCWRCGEFLFRIEPDYQGSMHLVPGLPGRDPAQEET